MFLRKKRTRYEYYFIEVDSPYHPKRSGIGGDMGAFGNLGSQGWRYIGITSGFYMFERKSYW